MGAAAVSNKARFESPIFDYPFEQLGPYIGNNAETLDFQIGNRFLYFGVDQPIHISPQEIIQRCYIRCQKPIHRTITLNYVVIEFFVHRNYFNLIGEPKVSICRSIALSIDCNVLIGNIFKKITQLYFVDVIACQ